MSCCDPRGCDQFFSPRFARRVANKYRKRGADKTARQMISYLEQRGIDGATVLEIGAGVGEISLELLKRGAVHAVNLELSPAYEEQARELIREAGLDDKLERRLHDIADGDDGIEPADVVVLHRVVCCYPDYARLLDAVAAHARSAVVFSYPRRNAISRLVVFAQNVTFRLLRREFQAYAHPPAAMLDVLTERGLRLSFEHHAPIWQVAGLARPVG